MRTDETLHLISPEGAIWKSTRDNHLFLNPFVFVSISSKPRLRAATFQKNTAFIP